MFDLEYCNWNKDLFMGVIPDTQFGDVATVDVGVISGAASAEVVLASSSGAAYRPVKTYAPLGTPNSHTEITVDDPQTSTIHFACTKTNGIRKARITTIKSSFIFLSCTSSIDHSISSRTSDFIRNMLSFRTCFDLQPRSD